MDKQARVLVSALTVAAYALIMFTASGFFYSSYQETMAACSRFSLADCRANDAVYVSLVSLKIGTGVFFLIGTFTWMIASYLGIRWVKMRATVSLP